ncbi:MAG: CAP domain-containing protein [Bdellovibrionaceae bacterium]|nr:CAP domain-containing protein [Bdellovibrio sp.]
MLEFKSNNFYSDTAGMNTNFTKNILFGSMMLAFTACGSGNFNSEVAPTVGSPNQGSSLPSISFPGEAPSGTVTDFKLTCEEARFIHFINIYRKSKSLNALNVSKNGVIAGRWHAQDMINKNYFDHTEPDGRAFYQRTASFGYSAHAENIAAGTYTGNDVFCQWQNSPGHNTNMLGNHSSTGIGLATGGGKYGAYWSSNFGGPAPDEIAPPLTLDAGCVLPTELLNCR